MAANPSIADSETVGEITSLFGALHCEELAEVNIYSKCPKTETKHSEAIPNVTWQRFETVANINSLFRKA